MPCGNIFFGIAGWSYPDWDGIVYPGAVRDKLAFVARYVDFIEINSTFYRLPAGHTAASWVERTGAKPGFFFTAKLPRDITHGGDLSPRIVSMVHDSLAPVARSRKLRHLLAQFRYDFENSPSTLEYVARIQASLGSLANVTLELRHKSWQTKETLSRLDSLGVTVANLDYPLARNSFDLRECLVGSHRYMRLHGRNAGAWFRKGAGRDETYNYYYSREELEEIGARATRLAGTAETLSVVGNNHFEGKELANMLQLKAMFSGGKVTAPAGLVSRYPDLGAIARPE